MVVRSLRNVPSATSSKSEEAALSSPLHLSEPLRKQKIVVCDLWLVDFDPFCLFLCFKLSCFALLLKSTGSFTLALRFF